MFGKKTEVVQTQTESALNRACHEFNRDDLYEPLSWIVSLRPMWSEANLSTFLSTRRYVIAANVMLYESRVPQAKEYFEQALRTLEPNSARYRRLSIVLANLDIVSRIARRAWELDGKLAPVTH